MLSSLFRSRKTASAPQKALEKKATRQRAEAALIQRIFALDPKTVEVEFIRKGLSSLSLAKFSGPEGPFMVRKTIEKDRHHEADFMTGLSRPHPFRTLSSFGWSMPDVYEVVESATAFDIYMEFVRGVGAAPRVDRKVLAKPLATAIHELQFTLAAVCTQHSLELQERGLPGKRFHAVVSHQLPGLASQLSEIVKIQRALPKIACHNDIHWPNFGAYQREKSFAIKFIDFGMLGLNVAGAELHHFARISSRSRKETDFFKELSHHYAKLAKLDPALVEMNAFFYAGLRLAAHERRERSEAGQISKDVAGILAEAVTRYELVRSKLI